MSLAQKLLEGGFDKHEAAMLGYLTTYQTRLQAYKTLRPKIAETLRAFETLGHVNIDAALHVNITVTGDKDLFVVCWKLLREIGIRLNPPAKGDTQIGQYHDLEGVTFWFHFSSTVCKRVQVGTKMVPQPIYETQCGEGLTVPQLEGDSTDVIPF